MRQELKLSKAILAELAGVSVRTWSRWESADGDMSAEGLAKVCDELGVSLDWLLAGHGAMYRDAEPEGSEPNDDKNGGRRSDDMVQYISELESRENYRLPSTIVMAIATSAGHRWITKEAVELIMERMKQLNV